MKAQIVMLAVITQCSVGYDFPLKHSDSIEKCFQLKNSLIDLCIKDKNAREPLPHGVSVNLKSRKDGTILLGNFPFILVKDPAVPNRNLKEYISASPNAFWGDLPSQAELLSKQFSPIIFDGSVNNETLDEVGKVLLGNKVYEYDLSFILGQ